MSNNNFNTLLNELVVRKQKFGYSSPNYTFKDFQIKKHKDGIFQEGLVNPEINKLTTLLDNLLIEQPTFFFQNRYPVQE